MIVDQSTFAPGEMGWGLWNDTEAQRLDEEHRQYDMLANQVPMRLARREPKTPNLELLSKVLDLQKDNGIDSGFCFLYLAEAVFGEQFDWKAQRIGSCVASGDMRTTGYRMLAECFLLNDPEELPGIDIEGPDALVFFAPYSYRAGRREGGINSGDGSYCGAHIKGKMKWGHLQCDAEGLESDTFPEPMSTNLYRKWGNSNSLLESFAPLAKVFPLLESEKVRSAADVKDLLTVHYKPANICSMWGFAPARELSWKLAGGESVWVYTRRGSWAHNMSVIGYVTVNGDDYLIIENSWGMNAHKNGAWFAITAETFDRWIGSAECMSVGEMDLSDQPAVWPD